MKKNTIALLTFAVAILTASCQKENISEQVVEYTPMTINAVANGIDIPATKTTLAFKYDVNWNQNDKIYVTDGSHKNTFTLSDGKGTPKGSFTQDGSPISFTGDVEAYYPSTMVKDLGKGILLEWPANQKNDQTIPMYCKKTLSSEGQGEQRMDFSSLGSVLRIAFTTPVSDIKLKSITIKDDETKMSGFFDVNESGCAIVSQYYGTNSITLDLGDTGVDVSNKINYFNIAVPAGHYQKFSITFTATDGKLCVMTGGNINIDHNTVGALSLTGKAFYPFGQGEADVKAEAGISGNKVKWVQLWAGGPKFAEYNVGATSATDVGSTMTFTEANKTGSDYVWGSNWCTPSYADMDELLKAATADGSTKVDCDYTQENEVYGFKFTGKGAYAGNSVFFPAQGGNSGGGDASYWSSSTVSANAASDMYLCYAAEYGWFSYWATDFQKAAFFVRPVLNN